MNLHRRKCKEPVIVVTFK